MLLAADLPSEDERRTALEAVPWAQSAKRLSGVVRSSFERGAIDNIDMSIGTENHARAALVAIYEGVDSLLQASFDIAESVLYEPIFNRLYPNDPLGAGEALAPPEDPRRLAVRLARSSIESAAVRIGSAGDHLANAHIRLAWEANAATEEEVRACGFDPSRVEPRTWSDVERLRRGLRAARKGSVYSVLDAFALNVVFGKFRSELPVRQARRFRDEVVHRARPSYVEAPSFGRNSKWAEGRIKISHPYKPDTTGLPTLADRRQIVSEAAAAALSYGEATWDLAVRWLRTVDIWITPSDRDVTIRTTHTPKPRFPRTQRDPDPFLVARPA